MTWLFTALIANTVVGIALGAMAFVASRCGRPPLAHVIWLLLVVKLITPPVMRVNAWKPATNEVQTTVPDSNVRTIVAAPAPRIPPAPIDHRVPARTTEQVIHVASAAPHSAVSESIVQGTIRRVDGISVSLFLVLIWAAGSLLYAGVVWVRLRRFCDLLKPTAPAEEAIVARVQALCESMRIALIPEVCIVNAPVSPMLFALRRTKLILPQSVVERLSPTQQRAVIAHELAHLRRGDHFVRWLEIVATTLLWWHPLLWLARFGLHEAEEQCCDAWVVATMTSSERHHHGRREYADALLDVLELTCLNRGAGGLLPAGASGLGRMTNLKRRLAMILADRTPEKAMSRGAKLAVVGLAAVALPLMPVRGEEHAAKNASSAVAATAPTTAAVAVDESTRKAVESLLDAAQDPDEQVRNAAREAIVRFGGKGVPVLLDAMSREKTAELASQLLPAIGVEGAEALIQAIDSPAPAVRERAMVTLRQMILPDQPQMGGPPGAAAAAAPPGGFNPAGEVFGGGGGGGAAYGPTSPLGAGIAQWVVAPATRAAGDSNAAVRRAAVQLLGASARLLGDPALVKPLTVALKDEDASVRLLGAQSLIALARTTTPGLTAALASAAQDSDGSVRIAALAALASMGPAAREAMPVVTAALRDSNPQVRVAAANALGAMQAAPDPSQVPPQGGVSLFGGGNNDLLTAAGNVWHWNKVGRNDLAGTEARSILQEKPKAEDLLTVFGQTAAMRGADLNTWVQSVKDVGELKDLAAALTRVMDSAAQPQNNGRPVEY